MKAVDIAVINETTLLKDEEVENAVTALQRQVSDEFSGAWGENATLTYVSHPDRTPSDVWQIVLLDDPEQAGALGYYDLTASGLPLGKVFLRSDRHDSSWTLSLSHETLEMLSDPEINLTVLVDDAKGRRLFAYEVCDACQDITLGYRVDDVLLSDFVYPFWFESFRAPGSTRFDHRGALRGPFELAVGGYISVLRISEPFGWQEVTAHGEPYKRRPPVGSRRERRRLAREHWMRSEK